MELTDKDIEIIESYFNQTLSEEDNQAFEQRLESDSAFRQAVYEYQATATFLNTVREREQKAFLKKIEATMPPVGIPIRRLDFRRWAVAAVGLVLVTVGVWQFWGGGDGGVKLKSLAKDYFEPYPALGITMGDEKVDIKTEALRTYAVNDFKNAIPLLQKAFEVEKDTMLLFYRDIAFIGIGQPGNAEDNLKVLLNSEIIPHELVKWYLALIYIELNQKENALPLLQNVADTEGENQEKAIDLMSKIKK